MIDTSNVDWQFAVFVVCLLLGLLYAQLVNKARAKKQQQQPKPQEPQPVKAATAAAGAAAETADAETADAALPTGPTLEAAVEAAAEPKPALEKKAD